MEASVGPLLKLDAQDRQKRDLQEVPILSTHFLISKKPLLVLTSQAWEERGTACASLMTS